MTTTTQDRAGIPAEAQHRRHAAILLIAAGLTAERLRGLVQEAWHLAVADEVEALAAAGLTQRHAERARGYDMRDGSTYVMRARFLDEGLTPDQVRKTAAEAPASKARFLARVADAMDQQLAWEARAGAEDS